MCVITASKPVLILYDTIREYEKKANVGSKITTTAHFDQIGPI